MQQMISVDASGGSLGYGSAPGKLGSAKITMIDTYPQGTGRYTAGVFCVRCTINVNLQQDGCKVLMCF